MRIIDLIYGHHPDKTIVDFLRFATKFLKINSLPKIKLLNNYIKGQHANSFAAYKPAEKCIELYVKNRHILDVLRSLGHELVHYRQDLQDQLTHNSGETGSNEENEANSLAGIMMRLYGKQNPKLFHTVENQ